MTIGPDRPKGEIMETLTMISTLHKNTSTGNYEPKASSLTIKIQTEKKLKSVGQVKIDLGKYADSEQDISEVLPLAKCPD